jgi:hypothetical protein
MQGLPEDSLIDDHVSVNNLLPNLIRNIATVFERALYLSAWKRG